MINIIVHIKGKANLLEIMALTNPNGNLKFPNGYFEIPEMIKCYSIVLPGKTRVKAFRRALREIAPQSEFIGAFKRDGSPCKWLQGEEEEDANFLISKYSKHLRKKQIRDEQGEVTSEVDYTEEEAKSIQVNNIFGWGKRILDDNS